MRFLQARFISCLSRFPFWVKVCLQSLHENGLEPWWVRAWSLALHNLGNSLWQIRHFIIWLSLLVLGFLLRNFSKVLLMSYYNSSYIWSAFSEFSQGSARLFSDYWANPGVFLSIYGVEISHISCYYWGIWCLISHVGPSILINSYGEPSLLTDLLS